MNVAAIVLAAGGSRRLGQPKQLLSLDGQSLLRRSVRAALGSRCTRVVVVTGASAGACAAEVSDLPVDVIHNPLWEDGMASSIQAGIRNLLARGCPLTAVVLSVCDQPFISPSIINQLIEKQTSSGRGIVASAYGGTFGVPALFDVHYLSALLNLNADMGARVLFHQFPDDFVAIDFSRGVVDVDTLKDYAFALEIERRA